MRLVFDHVLRWRSCQLLLILVFLATTVMADSGQLETVVSPAVVNVTWPEIVRLVDQHPRISAGKFQVEAARGAVSAAGAVPNPTLEATVGQGRERVSGDTHVEWDMSLTIPFDWVAQRSSRIDSARAEVAIAEAETDSLRRDVLLQLRTLFWDLAYEQELVLSLEALEAQTAALLATVNKRIEKGEARPVEALQVEVEREKVVSELESARISLSARRAELALWLGIPKNRALAVVADIGQLPIAKDLDTALSLARKTHPAFAAAQARTRFLEADLVTEKMARVPSFSLSAFTASEADQRVFGAGIGVDLPLWNWNSGRVAQAEAKLAAGHKQAQDAAFEVETTIINAQAACSASASTAMRYSEKVTPRAESAAATMEKIYQLGEASILEVIDTRRTLLESRRLYLSTIAQAQIDCSRLDTLIGAELK